MWNKMCFTIMLSSYETIFQHTCDATFVSIALAPLHSPFAGQRLCKIMIGHPTLRFSSDRGSPDALIELRYSEE